MNKKIHNWLPYKDHNETIKSGGQHNPTIA